MTVFYTNLVVWNLEGWEDFVFYFNRIDFEFACYGNRIRLYAANMDFT